MRGGVHTGGANSPSRHGGVERTDEGVVDVLEAASRSGEGVSSWSRLIISPACVRCDHSNRRRQDTDAHPAAGRCASPHPLFAKHWRLSSAREGLPTAWVG